MKTKYNNSYLYKALPKDYILYLKKHKIFKQFMKSYYNKIPLKVLILLISYCDTEYYNKLNKIRSLLCSILQYYIREIEDVHITNENPNINIRINIAVSKYLSDFVNEIKKKDVDMWLQYNNYIDGERVYDYITNRLSDIKAGKRPIIDYNQNVISQYKEWFKTIKTLY